MVDIKLTFEAETGLDGMDPLGDISISDGSSTIAERTTCLDWWLAALIEGYTQTRVSSHVSVDIRCERAPLHIEVTSNGLLLISYENKALSPQPPKDFEVALKKASRSFLEAIGNLPNAARNTSLDPIREFISTGSNGAG